jgi:hypothetical protein
MPTIMGLDYLSTTEVAGGPCEGGESPRRWFSVGCVSYEPDYKTYFGRRERRQRHPTFRGRKPALRYAMKEIRKFFGGQHSQSTSPGLPARSHQ